MKRVILLIFFSFIFLIFNVFADEDLDGNPDLAFFDENQDGIFETVIQYHPVDDSYYSEIIITDAVIETDNSIEINLNVNYNKLIENIGTNEGGVYHGIHNENQLLINNFIYLFASTLNRFLFVHD